MKSNDPMDSSTRSFFVIEAEEIDEEELTDTTEEDDKKKERKVSGLKMEMEERESMSHDLEISEHSTNYERLMLLCKNSFPIVVSFFIGIGAGFANLLFAGHVSHPKYSATVIFAGR